jgi:hypothetical protein
MSERASLGIGLEVERERERERSKRVGWGGELVKGAMDAGVFGAALGLCVFFNTLELS